MHVLVIQHVACEGPGWYGEVLAQRGAASEVFEIDEGQPLPEWQQFDALVVMGGPMGVNDHVQLPWLREEKRMIAEAVAADVPFWGVCLGAQLLAASLGAEVVTGPAPEVGVGPVELTPEADRDAVFAGIDSPLEVLHWHSDTFELPAGATLLSSSAVYPHQAYRVGRRAYGLQFHLEVSASMASEWVGIPAYAESLDRALGRSAAGSMLADLERAGPRMRDCAHTLFGHWLDLI